MSYKNYNKDKWNELVQQGDQWTLPVDEETIANARKGQLNIVLTPTRQIPTNWLPSSLKDVKILCLASGGGQQGPVLAAAGADVTVYDFSENQLAQDTFVAERENLTIKTVQGDMMDLSVFDDESFDMIIHPWSNCFVSDVNVVWSECARVLKTGGALLAGFGNPVDYIFDLEEIEKGNLVVRHSIPYADETDLTKDELQRLVIDKGEPMAFGHSLEDQLGGQLRAGLVIVDFYEDSFGGFAPIDKYINVGMATKAIKLGNQKIERDY